MRTVQILVLSVIFASSGCGRNENRSVSSDLDNVEQRIERALLDSVKDCILTNCCDAVSLGDRHQRELMKIGNGVSQVERARRFEDFVFGVRIDSLPYGERVRALVAIETLSAKAWLPAHMAQEWNRRLRMIEFMRQQKLSVARDRAQCRSGGCGHGGEGVSESGFSEYIESYLRTHLEFYELEFVERAKSEMGMDEYRNLSRYFEQVLGRKLRTAEQIKEDRLCTRKGISSSIR